MNRGTMGVNSLPKTVARQRRDCDLNPGRSAPESSTLTIRLPSYPFLPVAGSKIERLLFCTGCTYQKLVCVCVCVCHGFKTAPLNGGPTDRAIVGDNWRNHGWRATPGFSHYRAMLCIRGTSHGPVSVSVYVCVCHKSEFY